MSSQRDGSSHQHDAVAMFWKDYVADPSTEVVPAASASHNCYSEMSEIIPGLYLGPEEAVSALDAMLPFGISFVLAMNANETGFSLWEEVAKCDDESVVRTDDGRMFKTQDVLTYESFSNLLKEEMAKRTNWFLDQSPSCSQQSPAVKIFKRSIAADDNQFFDISRYFSECISLITIVMDARRCVEAFGFQNTTCLSERRIYPRVHRSSKRRCSTVSTSLPQDVFPPPPAVVVHCLVGMSRSTTIVLAYLMRTSGLPMESLLDKLLRIRRPIVQPNSGFVAQLTSWEACGYTTAKDEISCFEMVQGIQRARNGDLAPLESQKGALLKILNVYVPGNRFEIERLNMGRVFWGLAKPDHPNALTILDSLSLLTAILAFATVDGVYVDCPGYFKNFMQIMKGLSFHCPDAAIVNMAVTALLSLKDQEFCSVVAKLMVGEVNMDASMGFRNSLSGLWDRVLSEHFGQEGALCWLFHLSFVVVAISLRVDFPIITRVVMERFRQQEQARNIQHEEDIDDFDYSKEVLTRFFDALVSASG